MPATPPSVFAVGVKVAVRTVPLPDSAPSVPPETTMSAAVNVVPGSSLNVKVMAAVSPIFRAVTLLLMATVGALVSNTSAGLLPAPPGLPAASA